MANKITHIVQIVAQVEAVHIAWTCPVCENENEYEGAEGELETCQECEFVLPQHIWSADDHQVQEMEVDDELVSEHYDEFFKNDEEEENEDD